MIPLSIALFVTQGVTLALGLVVFLNNSKRLVNKQFLILSLHLTFWACCVFNIVQSNDRFMAEIWIRAAFFVTAYFPVSFTLLLSSIKYPSSSWIKLHKKHAWFFLFNIIASLLPLTPFFMRGVDIPVAAEIGPPSVPEAIYGAGYYIYVTYFIVTCLLAGITFYRAFRGAMGIQRYELQFILYGFGASFLVGAFSALLLPILTGSNQTSQYGPLGIILLDGVVAYGITTRRILGIATILQKITSYVLLSLYLIALYYITLVIANAVLDFLSIENSEISHVFSSMTVALSVLPVHGRLQAVANKLISSNSMDISGTVRKASSIFQSVTTMDALLAQFASLLTEALTTERILILTKLDNCFLQQYPFIDREMQLSLDDQNPICRSVSHMSSPVNRDALARFKQTKLTKDTDEQLSIRGLKIAIGVFSKGNLNGLILLGERVGGGIYDRNEQDALQILCNQFAVALENAQLYTEVQDSKIRNEIMLDQLVSGVILANTDRKITLFNHEAQRITGIREDAAMGMHIDILPRPIARQLEDALNQEKGERNIDARLFEQDETKKSLSIRMGTTFLHGHDQKPMGALLVFTDMTELKSLEEQVRRSDQLSSVGTLAAGMAHEIKNPLVTVKTFTQLLPQRYADEDFRKDFSELVAHEVARIDGIVNELLSFSKPTKPHLVPMKLHDTINQIVKLTHEQMVQKNITLKDCCHAENDFIQGDAKLLSQSLINLLLNAVEAIGNNGTTTVGTSNCNYKFASEEGPNRAITKPCIRVQISDTGQGIPKEHIQKIFDPFFTSKSEGTGMGLSVSHGIIREHHGVIDVESETGVGSTFYIYLPIIEEETA